MEEFVKSFFGASFVAEVNPLIGRFYVPTDNSYAIDKETGIDVDGLDGKEYVIVSEPYVQDVKTFVGTSVRRIFIDVFSIDSGRKYRVLFKENNIVNK